MSCEAVREFLLQTDWDAGQRAGAIEFLRHLDQCDACRAAMQDFDEVRVALSPPEPPEPAGGWDAMKERMIVSMPRRRSNWFIGPAGALAASVLVGLFAFHLGRGDKTQSNDAIAITKIKTIEQTAQAVSPPDISDDVQAFREMFAIYDGKTGWVMVSPTSSDVGIIAEPASSNARMLILRLGLWQRTELISKADLVVLSGHRAKLSLPLPSGQSLEYRIAASTEEPTQLSVALEIKTSGSGEPTAALATSLAMTPGQNVSVGRLATSQGEYELKIDFAGAEPAVAKP